jgi:hypothetical protein
LSFALPMIECIAAARSSPQSVPDGIVGQTNAPIVEKTRARFSSTATTRGDATPDERQRGRARQQVSTAFPWIDSYRKPPECREMTRNWHSCHRVGFKESLH